MATNNSYQNDWIWNYFQKFEKFQVRCKLCADISPYVYTVITYTDGVSILKGHFKKHFTARNEKHWIWQYIKKLNNDYVKCKEENCSATFSKNKWEPYKWEEHLRVRHKIYANQEEDNPSQIRYMWQHMTLHDDWQAECNFTGCNFSIMVTCNDSFVDKLIRHIRETHPLYIFDIREQDKENINPNAQI